MGLLDWISLSRGGIGAVNADADAAVRNGCAETLAQEMQKSWRFTARRQALEMYILACIQELPAEQREQLEQTSGKDWQDALRSEYGLDADFDEMIRANWHARLVASRNPQADPAPFANSMMCLHLDQRVEQKVESLPARSREAIAESYRRKQRSEVRLRARGVPIKSELPVYESSHETTLRSMSEVRKRATVLFYVAAAYDKMLTNGAEMLETLTGMGLAQDIAPSEQRLLMLGNPTEEERLEMMWLFEAAHTLLWALGEISIGEPTKRCSDNKVFQAILHIAPWRFRLSKVKLRPVGQILDELDYTYRYHWAVVEAYLNGLPVPNDALPWVLKMRHHALNWIVGYGGPEWDSVSTDT